MAGVDVDVVGAVDPAPVLEAILGGGGVNRPPVPPTLVAGAVDPAVVVVDERV